MLDYWADIGFHTGQNMVSVLVFQVVQEDSDLLISFCINPPSGACRYVDNCMQCAYSIW